MTAAASRKEEEAPPAQRRGRATTELGKHSLTLPVRNLSPREGTCLAQGHIASQV